MEGGSGGGGDAAAAARRRRQRLRLRWAAVGAAAGTCSIAGVRWCSGRDGGPLDFVLRFPWKQVETPAVYKKHHGPHELRWGIVAVICCVAGTFLIRFLQRRAEKGVLEEPRKFRGATLKPLTVCLAVGMFIRYGLPIPEGLTVKAWTMLAVFTAMIIGVVTGPMPPASTTLVCLGISLITGTVTFNEGMHAFTDEVVWLVLVAYFMGSCFDKTGLGNRIAHTVISTVGGTTTGLAYGLNFTETCIAMTMPSSAARAAAVFYPITTAVCKASGSDPERGTRMRCGAYLIECIYQSTATSSCLFLSGAAQNYFILALGHEVGVDFESPYRDWFLAALGPAVASFLLTPVLAAWLLPPQVHSTPEAPGIARLKLQALGPVKDSEKVLGAVMAVMIVLWAGSGTFHIRPVVTAIVGFGVLLLLGVITWEDCANNPQAWGTYVSFACLVGLARMLANLGVVDWIATSITSVIIAAGFSTVSAYLFILASYWCCHYLFASQVAHVSSLYQPFLLMMIQTGTPPKAAFYTLAFASNLFMTLTPYASAQSAVFFSGNYITAQEWYKVGLAYFIFYFVVWVGVGSVWWKLIGLI